MLSTVQNVGLVLDLYSAEHPERGVSEIARELDMSRSTVHLLLSSMAEVGILRKVPGGRYRIGWRALQLDRIAAETTPFRLPGRAAVVALARRTGETAHLATLDQGRVLYVDRMQGERARPLEISEVGATLPAHCSGVGKLLLAHAAPEEADAMLDRHGLPPFTSHTITARDALREEFGRIRLAGVSFDREEVLTGLSCVAAPVRDQSGAVVAALSVAVPTPRMEQQEDELRRLVESAASSVTRRLQRT